MGYRFTMKVVIRGVIKVNIPAFEQEREFPNYFKIMLANEKNDQKRVELTKKIEKLIEQNIQAVVKRLKLYYVDNGKLEHSDYFNKLVEKMHEALGENLQSINETLGPGEVKYDYELKVNLSGGVVRTLLAYVYKQLHIAMQNIIKEEIGKKNEKENNDTNPFSPSLDTRENFLKNITKTPEFWLEKLRHEQQKMKGFYVLGVGSDIDILYRLEPKAGTHAISDEQLKELQDKIKNTADDFLNSANGLLNLDFLSEDFRSSLLPPADVNNYNEQITESMRQGGSALDWLAFELGKKGKIIEPSKELMEQAKLPALKTSILENFIQGQYEYVETEISYTDKQAIRGVRMLLESGFTSVSDPKKLHAQLKAVLEKSPRDASGKLILSDGAIKQLLKLRRNANFEGAHNRAYRESPDSPLTLIRQIINELPEELKKKVQLPQYLQATNRLDKKTAKGILSKGMVPFSGDNGFLARFTDNGILYHGTSADAVTSIIKGGFFISNATQGTAFYGSGVYSTPNRDVAYHEYGSNVFPLHINDNNEIKIVDMSIIKQDQALFAELSQEMANKGYQDINELLSMEYDIDIILYKVDNDKKEDEFYVLLQNTSVIRPVTVQDMIEPYKDSFKDSTKGSTYLGKIVLDNKSYVVLKEDILLSSKQDAKSNTEVYQKFQEYSNLYLLSDNTDNDKDSPVNIIKKLIASTEALKNATPPVNLNMTNQLIYENCFLAEPDYVWNNLDKIINEAKANPKVESALLKFVINFTFSFKNNQNQDNLVALLKNLLNAKSNKLIEQVLEKLKSVLPQQLKNLNLKNVLNYQEILSLLRVIEDKGLLRQYIHALSINPHADDKESSREFSVSRMLHQDSEYIRKINEMMLYAAKVDSVELFFSMFNARLSKILIKDASADNLLTEAISNASFDIVNMLLNDDHLRLEFDPKTLELAADQVVQNVFKAMVLKDEAKVECFEKILLMLMKKDVKLSQEIVSQEFTGTILEFACYAKMSDLALELLKDENDFYLQKNINSAFVYACENGLENVVEKMISNGKIIPELNKEFMRPWEEYNTTPLITALLAKNTNIVSKLMDAGVSNFDFLYRGPLPNPFFKIDPVNAIEIAIEFGYIPLAKKMILKASSNNIEITNYEKILEMACVSGDMELIDSRWR